MDSLFGTGKGVEQLSITDSSSTTVTDLENRQGDVLDGLFFCKHKSEGMDWSRASGEEKELKRNRDNYSTGSGISEEEEESTYVSLFGDPDAPFVPKGKFPFFKLPGELRNIIYNEVEDLRKPDGLSFQYFVKLVARERVAQKAPIFQVSKAMRSEAFDILLHNTVVMNGVSSLKFDRSELEYLMSPSAESARGMIRHLRLDSHGVNLRENQSFFDPVEFVAQCPRLKQVEMTVTSRDYEEIRDQLMFAAAREFRRTRSSAHFPTIFESSRHPPAIIKALRIDELTQGPSIRKLVIHCCYPRGYMKIQPREYLDELKEILELKLSDRGIAFEARLVGEEEEMDEE